MKLCSKCAVDMEEYYFWMFMFSRDTCECCKKEKLVFDVTTINDSCYA